MVTNLKDMLSESVILIERHSSPGMVVSCVNQGVLREVFISAWTLEGEIHRDVFERVANVLNDFDATVINQEVFGFCGSDGGHTALEEVLGAQNWPVTWLEGSPESSCSGTEIWAVKSACVQPVQLNGVTVGSVFENGETRICRLGGLLPSDRTVSPSCQTQAVFDLMEEALCMAGMDFSHVIRTWFHNHDILSWYRDFNRIRTRFFEDKGVFQKLVPASTGVSGNNSHGAALTAGLLAIKSDDPGVRVEALPSPLQCPALDYGSSFSRAVAVQGQDHQRVHISGTASISPNSQIAYLDDITGQIRLTLEVVLAILNSRNLSWSDVVRAIAYVKHPSHVEDSKRILATAGLTDFPLIYTQTDLCYADLLFEMEVDAIGPLVITGS